MSFIGYPFGKKGYKILDLQSRKCFYSRDVTFVEIEFSYHTKASVSPVDTHGPDLLYPLSVTTEDSSNHHIVAPSSPNSIPVNILSQPENNTYSIARPARVKHLPSIIKDLTGLPSIHAVLPSLYASSTSGKVSSTATYPIQQYLSYSDFTPKYQSYLTAMSEIPTPYTFNQAAPDKHWFKAMQTEIAALEDNHT